MGGTGETPFENAEVDEFVKNWKCSDCDSAVALVVRNGAFALDVAHDETCPFMKGAVQ